jgi:hypothetical protein|tara:strand:+ start:258 stop:443 length:186 start_codon:yes stop_codon:yes gene_type:complete
VLKTRSNNEHKIKQKKTKKNKKKQKKQKKLISIMGIIFFFVNKKIEMKKVNKKIVINFSKQ